MGGLNKGIFMMITAIILKRAVKGPAHKSHYGGFLLCIASDYVLRERPYYAVVSNSTVYHTFHRSMPSCNLEHTY